MLNQCQEEYSFEGYLALRKYSIQNCACENQSLIVPKEILFGSLKIYLLFAHGKSCLDLNSDKSDACNIL